MIERLCKVGLLSIGWAALVVVAALACWAPAEALRSTPGGVDAAPSLYGAGLFTTGAYDFYLAFSPDQRRVLFGRSDEAFERYELLESRLGADGRWTAPRRPRFAEQWSNADPHFTADGTAVHFISNRPYPGESQERATLDIYLVRPGADGEWSEPERLPAPVNDPDRDEFGPMAASNGDLYFGAEREGTRGGSDLWVSRLVGGVYQPPENLGDGINTMAHELEPWIARDGSFLIFSALRRPDGVGGYDLFVSHRTPAGTWGPARLLGGGVNTEATEFCHSVSPDGRWLYFTSLRKHSGPPGERFDWPRDESNVHGIGSGRAGDVYRIPMRALGL